MVNHDKISIKTKRLKIEPLRLNSLLLITESAYLYSRVHHLEYRGFSFDEETRTVIKDELIPKLSNNSDKWYYHTMWLIIELSSNVIVGSFCFYGEPNSKNEIEIGYGISPGFQNNGFMSEVFGGLSIWAIKRKIYYIVARCDRSNIASFKVLIKSGFDLLDTRDNLYHWKLSLMELNSLGWFTTSSEFNNTE
ncbi:MAG: GNAT family N-acetyltransferase [Chlorobi bacterium]|nr:GNAT family N-acetyltransferase [Chlorobiota bacterium]